MLLLQVLIMGHPYLYCWAEFCGNGSRGCQLPQYTANSNVQIGLTWKTEDPCIRFPGECRPREDDLPKRPVQLWAHAYTGRSCPPSVAATISGAVGISRGLAPQLISPATSGYETGRRIYIRDVGHRGLLWKTSVG